MPLRVQSSIGGDLELPPLSGQRNDENLKLPGFSGGIGEPLTVGREVTLGLEERALNQGRQLLLL